MFRLDPKRRLSKYVNNNVIAESYISSGLNYLWNNCLIN